MDQEFDNLIAKAHQALESGSIGVARTDAKAALKIAQRHGNVLMEAKAHLCLAHGDRMVSRIRRAQVSGQRAAFLFQMGGDIKGEAAALAIVSYAFSVLAQVEESIEAALLSVKLNEQSAGGLALANSYNYLGLAYSYSWNFNEADAAFDRAIAIHTTALPGSDAYLPRMNQRAMEVVRAFYGRYFDGTMPSLDRLATLREQQNNLSHHATTKSPLQSTYIDNKPIVLLTDGFEHCWRGNLALALADADAAAVQASKFETSPSYLTIEHWLRAEIAWASGNMDAALAHCAQVIALGVQVEDEHMATIGHLLATQLYASVGRHAEAHDHQRQLRRREQMLKNEAVKSRGAAVQWQLKARASHENMQRMELAAKQLEKLSFEDPLTGLPNRRKFEQYLPDMLRKGFERGAPPFVAFIDIDQFKSVNDQHSHKVGDDVLRRIALILKAFVRDGDLPARIAGDEFVIAFENVDAATMQQVKERISSAVAGFDWNSIAPGLRASVSIGVSQAQYGDTVESLTHRSDLAMYADKKTLQQVA